MEKKIEVVNNNGQLVVSSRQVAEHFGKQHRDVLKAIRNLLEGMRKSSQTPMFHETTYVNEQNGQSYPMYLMNRDGFSLLAMASRVARLLNGNSSTFRHLMRWKRPSRNTWIPT